MKQRGSLAPGRYQAFSTMNLFSNAVWSSLLHGFQWIWLLLLMKVKDAVIQLSDGPLACRSFHVISIHCHATPLCAQAMRGFN